MKGLPNTLVAPDRPDGLPADAKWLAGEGAGSWFVFSTTDEGILIKRFSPQGKMECTGIFRANAALDLHKEFTMDYPSHCIQVTTVQSGSRIHLGRVDDSNN